MSLLQRVAAAGHLGLSKFYAVTISAQNPFWKASGLLIICGLLQLRLLRLYIRQPLVVGAVAGAVALLISKCGLVGTLLALLPAWALYVWPDVYDNLSINVGHRAGAKGFDGGYANREFDPQLLMRMQLPPGDCCENTLQALASLAAWDDAHGPLAGLQYVEIDVHETKDGELVVFHDDTITRAFTFAGHNITKIRRMGLALRQRIQDMSYEQLLQLDVGGRAGVKVPTLAQFLDAAAGGGQHPALRCAVAVEVKGLHSDAGREKLIALCRGYRERVSARLNAECPERRDRHLGWIAVIAFPHYFAASFGEFGGRDWARWGAALKAAGLPARCCHFHGVSLIAGL